MQTAAPFQALLCRTDRKRGESVKYILEVLMYKCVRTTVLRCVSKVPRVFFPSPRANKRNAEKKKFDQGAKRRFAVAGACAENTGSALAGVDERPGSVQRHISELIQSRVYVAPRVGVSASALIITCPAAFL